MADAGRHCVHRPGDGGDWPSRAAVTVDEIIAAVHAKAAGRTRYEGQALRWDEMLVGEIGRLRSELDGAARMMSTGMAEIERLRAELAVFSNALAKAEDERRTVARVAAAGGAENVKLREFILLLQAEIRRRDAP